MKIKIQDRQTGKTTDMIEAMKGDKDSIMIVPTNYMRCYVTGIDKRLKGRVFTLQEVANGNIRERHYSRAYIDEVGCCLDTIIPKIVYGTHTNYG